MKESKKKVKDAAHKVVDVVTPNSGEEASWKKDVLEGRPKRIGNSKMDADGKANFDQRTEAEQKRLPGDV